MLLSVEDVEASAVQDGERERRPVSDWLCSLREMLTEPDLQFSFFFSLSLSLCPMQSDSLKSMENETKAVERKSRCTSTSSKTSTASGGFILSELELDH